MVATANADDYNVPNHISVIKKVLQLCLTFGWPTHYLYQDVTIYTLQKSSQPTTICHIALSADVKKVKFSPVGYAFDTETSSSCLKKILLTVILAGGKDKMQPNILKLQKYFD